MTRQEVSDAVRDDIDTRFAFHPATPVTGDTHERVRNLHRTLAHELVSVVPAGRHLSLALTALEESMHWSNAAIACHRPGAR